MSANMIYCHGLPGGKGDLGIADWPERLRPVVLSPLTDTLTGTLADSSAGSSAGEGAVHIVGFSGGSWTVLRLAARDSRRVEMVSLIAPLVPLELGDFTPMSVSGPLLELARDDPAAADTALREIARGAGPAPDAVLDQLMEGTPKSEQDLARDPALRPHYLDNLKSGFGDGLDETVAAFLSVAQPWSDWLGDIAVPVRITVGSADRRCPPAMAHALATAIGNNACVEMLDGLGHYGALRAFAARLS